MFMAAIDVRRRENYERKATTTETAIQPKTANARNENREAFVRNAHAFRYGGSSYG
jgi:hypothetical protein